MTHLALGLFENRGHRRIAHIGGTASSSGLRSRANSETMEAGLTADIELCDTSEEGGYRAGLRLLDRPTAERATAVFAASDLMRSASCRPRPNSTTPYWATSLWSGDEARTTRAECRTKPIGCHSLQEGRCLLGCPGFHLVPGLTGSFDHLGDVAAQVALPYRVLQDRAQQGKCHIDGPGPSPFRCTLPTRRPLSCR